MADPYVYPGTETLINKFNIQDSAALQDLENSIFVNKPQNEIPKGNFDYDHLKAIHQYFFGDLYEWAGKERTIDISKGSSLFGNTRYIESFLDKKFLELKEDNYLKAFSKEDFIEKLSYYFNEINAAHPFREGNGRTLRAFCQGLAREAGYSLDWSRVERSEYLQASIDGFDAKYAPMENILAKICTEIVQEKKVVQNNSLASVKLSTDTKDLLIAYIDAYEKFNEAVKQKVIHMGEDKNLHKKYSNESMQHNAYMQEIADKLIKKDDFINIKVILLQSLDKIKGLNFNRLNLEDMKVSIKNNDLHHDQVFCLLNRVQKSSPIYQRERIKDISNEITR